MNVLLNLIQNRRFEYAADKLQSIHNSVRKRVVLQKIIHPIAGALFVILLLFGFLDVMQFRICDKILRLEANHYLAAGFWIIVAFVVPMFVSLLIFILGSIIYKGEKVLPVVGTDTEMAYELLKRVEKLPFKKRIFRKYGRIFGWIFTLCVMGLVAYTYVRKYAFEVSIPYVAGFFGGAVALYWIFKLVYGLFFVMNNLFCRVKLTNNNVQNIHNTLAVIAVQCKHEEEGNKKRKSEEEKLERIKRETEQAMQKAREAEYNYQLALDNGTLNDELAIKAAKEGSPSAGLYIGQKIYGEISESRRKRNRTKHELKMMSEQASAYLKVAARRGVKQAELLLLSLEVETNTYSLAEWEKRLAKARKLAETPGLEEYKEISEKLISIIVTAIDEM